MKHPYRIREIAAQAGLSQATVDRVLHGRGGVRESTVREVHQAIAALDRQRGESPGPARVPIDVVVRDRERVEAALRAESGVLRPVVVRPRFHSADDPVAALARVARSRSRGVILQAAETPELVEAVGRLEIPVVTLGPDMPASKRVAHIGLDDRQAGATAAYLVEQWLADRAGAVLIVSEDGRSVAPDGGRSVAPDGGRSVAPDGGRSVAPDNGEGSNVGNVSLAESGNAAATACQERIAGFRAELLRRAPHRRLLAAEPATIMRELAANPSVRAVYDPGTESAAAVVEAFAAVRRNYDVFVAHELGDVNAELLRAGQLSAVVQHDLRAALRLACLAVLQALGALPGPARSSAATIQVVTPLNLPTV